MVNQVVIRRSSVNPVVTWSSVLRIVLTVLFECSLSCFSDVDQVVFSFLHEAHPVVTCSGAGTMVVHVISVQPTDKKCEIKLVLYCS